MSNKQRVKRLEKDLTSDGYTLYDVHEMIDGVEYCPKIVWSTAGGFEKTYLTMEEYREEINNCEDLISVGGKNNERGKSLIIDFE